MKYLYGLLTLALVFAAPAFAGKIYGSISEGGKPATILHGGHYDDVYVKTSQGWRIKSRTYVRSEIGPQPAAR